MTITEALRQARLELSHSDNPRLEAEVLLCHVLGCARTYCYTWPEAALEHHHLAQFQHLCARRAHGEPLAYVTGMREFWSLPLQVTPAVLIPRPDSETLVEQALALIPTQAKWQIADLGTGSGALALALAHERPHCHIFAIERSPAALQVAQTNATVLGVNNVRWILSDWWQAVDCAPLDVIVSNPPYLAADDPHIHKGDLRFEPAAALISGADGLEDLYHLIHSSRTHLRPGGYLLLEHGYTQGAAVRTYLHAQGYTHIKTFTDLNAHPRVSCAQI
jgi:release factor glutamine methyltransferase